MRIVVCIRQAQTGEMSPFETSAYEAALRIENAEIILLSMGAPSAEGYLQSLTRLGASSAVLLTDPRFAGADTLATAYTLSLAIKNLQPDLIFCGRQTLEGDTAQTPLMLAELLGFPCVREVLSVTQQCASFFCATRSEAAIKITAPTLCIWERSADLRLPRLGSAVKTVSLWNADTIGAEPARCGLFGSPTRVLQMRENEGGRRRCTFLPPAQFSETVQTALQKELLPASADDCPVKLPHILIFSEALRPAANAAASRVTYETPGTTADAVRAIEKQNPDAVLWDCTPEQKRLSAAVAARMQLGLCADCTALRTDGKELRMIRPARAGSVLAEVRSLTRPAMATVRTQSTAEGDIVLTAGYGAKDNLAQLSALAATLHADFGASRKAVDSGLLPYPLQIGLTGKTVSPKVYIAVGVSGAVHHIVGMQRSGTVIAVNPDRNAPIFDYADYGFLCNAETLLKEVL